MLKRSIPRTGEKIGVIGLGTFKSFDVRLGRRPRAALHEVLDSFFERGGTVIDSSPMYGRAEDVVGALLEERGEVDGAFVATKVWTRGGDAGRRQMQESAKKLRAPEIDLMQVHNMVDYDTHIRTLRAMKEAGAIRYIGVTHYAPSGFEALARALRTDEIDFAQFPYSIATRDAEDMLLPLCAERGVATLINRPLEQGALFGRVRRAALPPWAVELGASSWTQLFLKYVLGDPAVTCVIPATGDAEHMRDNAAAGEGWMPDPAERRRLATLFDQL